MLPIDADSHFFEPLDLFERYIDPRFRERTYRVQNDSDTGKLQFVSIRSRCKCSTPKGCYAQSSATARRRPAAI